jgi:hypothetical protein
VAGLPLAGPGGRSDQALSHENEGAFRVHGGCDKLEMAGVAGQASIADAAHAIPLLHRGVGALDAGAVSGANPAPFDAFNARSPDR